MKATYSDDRAILKGVTGSRAYGLNHAGSDTDYIGVWIAPMNDVLGFTETKVSYHFSLEDDLHVHELEKFLSLVMKGNPTVTELLFLEDYVIQTELGRALLDHRSSMIGAKSVMDAYAGYAISQVRRCKNESDFLKRAKHLRHCFRLLIQARDFLTTGELTVRLTETQADFVRAMSVRDDFESSFKDLMWQCESVYASTDLPLQPDRDLINDFLIWARIENE